MTVYAMSQPIVYMTFLAIDMPAWWATVLGFANPLLDQFLALHGAVGPAVVLLVPALLWITFRNKKPRRLSIFLMRLGSIAMLVATLMVIVSEDFFTDLQSFAIYETIYLLAYIFTYLFYMVGSVFGILGAAKP